MRSFLLAPLAGLTFAACGCSFLERATAPRYVTLLIERAEGEDKAREETQRAAALFRKGKVDEAEKALKNALAADVNYAPAHNNLGNVYFARGEYYLAAWEFEYAVRLMPNHPEPLNNLGAVYEQVGRLERAIECYTLAYAMQPRNPELIANLARARLKNDESDSQVQGLLGDLVFYDTRPDRVEWAREELELGKFPPSPVFFHLSSPPAETFPPFQDAERIPPGRAIPLDPGQPRSLPIRPEQIGPAVRPRE